MNSILRPSGLLIGMLGLLLMAVAVAARLARHFTLGGFETGTLMLVGVAAVNVGCFLLLWLLVEERRH